MEKHLQDLGLTVKVDTYLSDGAREKYWCRTERARYLYKEDKEHANGEKTYESVSEFLAKRIGDLIDVPVVPIVLGDHYILSQALTAEEVHNFIEYSEEFSHSFHLSNLQTYTLGTLLSDKNRYRDEVIEMLLFDILIGNSDRHPGNFGYTSEGFYPLFDNGSSLCAYVREDSIQSFFKDKLRFKALCYSKSRPTIRGEETLTHYELLKQLESMFPAQVDRFRGNLLLFAPEDVLGDLPISDIRQDLLKRFIEERLKWFGVV